MGLLADFQIARLAEAGGIIPFDPMRVQPASYDVTLGNYFRVFNTSQPIDLSDPSTYLNVTTPIKVGDAGYSLMPGEFLLAEIHETVRLPNDIGAQVEGKSSLGRLGLVVHATAGFIDPGFEGVITLEMTNWLKVPIVLRPGLPIAQLAFFTMQALPDKPYNGRYQGDERVAASRYEAK